jgi:RND family efflux transporter MFP subunit
MVSTIEVEFIATGQTEAKEVVVASQYWGILEEILVQKDDVVKKGQLLAVARDIEGEDELRGLRRNQMTQKSQRDEFLYRLQLRRRQLEAGVERRVAEGQRSMAEYREVISGVSPEVLAQAVASVDEAKAQLRQSRREKERLQKLFEDDIASQAQVEKAEMEEEIAVARRTRALKRLEELKKGASAEKLASARANLAISRTDLEKNEEIDIELALLEQELRTKNLEIWRSDDEIRTLEERLSRGRIVSPVDGLVVETPIEPGETVHRGTAVATILDPTEVWVEADVAEQDSGYVSVGQEVTVSFPSLGAKSFEGKVESVAASLRTPTGSAGNARFLQIRVRLLQMPEGLRAGLEADVEGGRVLAKDVLTVPRQAIVRDGKENYVVQINGSKTQRVKVELGASDADKMEIKGEFAESATVVIDQPSRFVDGTEVTVQP